MAHQQKQSKYSAKGAAFVYSPQYRAWKAAALGFGASSSQAVAASHDHEARFKPRPVRKAWAGKAKVHFKDRPKHIAGRES